MRQREDFSGPTCRRCQAPVTEDVKVCTCGYPTVFMTFDERTKYEMEQYRVSKERDSLSA